MNHSKCPLPITLVTLCIFGETNRIISKAVDISCPRHKNYTTLAVLSHWFRYRNKKATWLTLNQYLSRRGSYNNYQTRTNQVLQYYQRGPRFVIINRHVKNSRRRQQSWWYGTSLRQIMIPRESDLTNER
jgi:hypothetical protein